MMRKCIPIFLIGWSLLAALPAAAQEIQFLGQVVGAESGEPITNAEVITLSEKIFTDQSGKFEFRREVEDSILLRIEAPGFEPRKYVVFPDFGAVVDLGTVELKKSIPETPPYTFDDPFQEDTPEEQQTERKKRRTDIDAELDQAIVELFPVEEELDRATFEDFVPAIALTTQDLEIGGADRVSDLLNASRDAFITAAAYTFSSARFRMRGYDGRNITMMLNGAPFNDLGSGFVFWSAWGGLNDVTRNRTGTTGLMLNANTFGSVGGASSIDLRPSQQRKQFRVSYANANRTYDHRVMATYTTGELSSGWAFTLSGSRRWAQEAYVPGTFYDAYSYYLGIEKSIGRRHALSLNAFGAPIQRGQGGAATMELYDLAGTNYYNPNWGFQAGKVRNARVRTTHQPVVMLRHDWEFTPRTHLTTTVSYQTGRNGTTALDWYDTPDPRPDYYRKLPSFIDNPQADLVEEALRENEALRQLDWDGFFDVNRNSLVTIENVDGIPGNNVTGLRSQYIVEERRFDNDRLNIGSTFESILGEKVRLTVGLTYQQQTDHNYKLVDDLLGGEFYLDIDKFAEFDSTSNNDFIQNDLDNPNRLAREGDRFGYDYRMHAQRGGAWVQFDFSLDKAEFFIAGSADYNRFWREGLVRNGKFPENSIGESDKQDFLGYGVKLGTTFKIDGRNYLLLNGGHISRAPFFRDSYVSPRTRDQAIPNLSNEDIYAIEGGYLMRGPYMKIRAIGFWSRFENQISNRSFYLDNAIQTEDGTRGGFVNYIMTGINTQHFGVELGAEVQLGAGFRAIGAAAIGQYTYTSRPTVSVILDNQAEVLRQDRVYIRNFYVPNVPQQAYTVGLGYNSSKYWFANVNFNYYDEIWLDFNPDRRTVDAVAFGNDPTFSQDFVEPGSELWEDILYQEKAPAAYTMDFFGGKSFKFNETFLYLTVGVNNILDNQDFITGGYEQYRFDYDDKDTSIFPNRYFYSFGRTYFVNVAFRI